MRERKWDVVGGRKEGGLWENIGQDLLKRLVVATKTDQVVEWVRSEKYNKNRPGGRVGEK